MSSVFQENKLFWEQHKQIFIEKDKMCRTGKTWLIGLLAVGTLFVGTTSATYHLPDTSYNDHFWQGNSTYKNNGHNMPTEFAIYDTEKLRLEYNIMLYNQPNTAGLYINTLQIFNHPNTGYETIEYFDILDLDRHQIGGALFKGESACYDNWPCREVLIPQRNGSQRGSEKTFNRGCLGGDRYLQFWY